MGIRPRAKAPGKLTFRRFFLGLATDVEEEGVLIILNGEKAMTSRLHAIFKGVEASPLELPQ